MHTSYMQKSYFHTCIGSGLLALAVLASSGGSAMAATKTVIRTKGMEASAGFDAQQVRTCVGGSTALDSTSVNISMFESTTTTNGSTQTVLQTSMSVSRFDGCAFESSFGFGLFTGVGTLQLTALESGRMTGTFVLDDGTRVVVNVTLTGSDTTTLGVTARRSILGRTMMVQRSSGSSRTATISGTVTVDGQPFSVAQATNPNGSLARNTGGEITIIKP
jgi:hypothetical protein